MNALAYRIGAEPTKAGNIPAIVIEGCTPEELPGLRHRICAAEIKTGVSLCVSQQEAVVSVTICCKQVISNPEAKRKLQAVIDCLEDED